MAVLRLPFTDAFAAALNGQIAHSGSVTALRRAARALKMLQLDRVGDGVGDGEGDGDGDGEGDGLTTTPVWFFEAGPSSWRSYSEATLCPSTSRRAGSTTSLYCVPGLSSRPLMVTVRFA